MAETSIGTAIVITPAISDFDVFVPGKTYDGSFRIVNNTEDPLDIVLEYYDVTQENGIPSLLENGDPEYSIREWINLCCDKLTIQPRSTKVVKYTLRVPSKLPPGGKYGVIIAKIKGKTGNLAGLSLNEGLGHVIIGKAEKNSIRDSEIEYFTVDKKINIVWPFKDTNFVLKVVNHGNVHERISGYLYVYKHKPSETVDIQALNPAKSVILPNSYREYTYKLNPPKVFSRSNKGITFNTKGILFGKYYALVRVKHYSKNNLVTDEQYVSFWILPWYIILIILVILLYLYKILHGLRNKD